MANGTDLLEALRRRVVELETGQAAAGGASPAFLASLATAPQTDWVGSLGAFGPGGRFAEARAWWSGEPGSAWPEPTFGAGESAFGAGELTGAAPRRVGAPERQ